VKKLPIRVIKQKDAEAAALKVMIDKDQRQTTNLQQDRIRDREVTAAISAWICARSKKTRIEQIAAIQEVFGT
jgi:hypothetical protein